MSLDRPVWTFEVKWEPRTSSNVCGNYLASHKEGVTVTTFTTRRQGPQLPPALMAERPLRSYPKTDRQALREVVRFRYLRSEDGFNWSMPAIVNLLH